MADAPDARQDELTDTLKRIDVAIMPDHWAADIRKTADGRFRVDYHEWFPAAVSEEAIVRTLAVLRRIGGDLRSSRYEAVPEGWHLALEFASDRAGSAGMVLGEAMGQIYASFGDPEEARKVVLEAVEWCHQVLGPKVRNQEGLPP
ncbi:MAG TPA: hypothetical protein VMG99_08990 [Thermoplasmata archaeon]|nr:hypothetical protein [Thermoplasmata archaeon]